MMPGIWYIVGIYTTYEGVYLEVGGKFEYIKYLLRYSISELRVFALFGYFYLKIVCRTVS